MSAVSIPGSEEETGTSRAMKMPGETHDKFGHKGETRTVAIFIIG